ncbi:hypothetical protein OGATHE_006616 [Ogataea polymorpha]|uniref:Uncharacterized protein n=1 Tax=Ogataea polymorpha TaxID=460523 RepID=A0A9P8NS56_9ASCO|nr:hypothetical protein OGATHE_006616 [Ogataea polymorpha]
MVAIRAFLLKSPFMESKELDGRTSVAKRSVPLPTTSVVDSSSVEDVVIDRICLVVYLEYFCESVAFDAPFMVSVAVKAIDVSISGQDENSFVKSKVLIAFRRCAIQQQTNVMLCSSNVSGPVFFTFEIFSGDCQPFVAVDYFNIFDLG